MNGKLFPKIFVLLIVGITQVHSPVRIILPSEDQKSSDVRRQLSDLGKKINSDLRPVFTSNKISDDTKVAEAKPPLIKHQCVVYKFKCDLCDADYVAILADPFSNALKNTNSANGKHLLFTYFIYSV